MKNPWVLLVISGLLEVCWATGLKYSEGFTKLIPSIFTLVTLAGSMLLLTKAAQSLPLGTAYGVWVGIGTVGAAIMGIVLFKEPATFARLAFLSLLVLSLVGLKLTSAE